MKNILKKLISVNVCNALIFQQVLLGSNIVVDNNANQVNQATLAKKNGIDIVNIVKPNKQGLSHNKFTDYNVNKNGLILNNSNQAYIKTQLAGYINGNKNLKYSDSAKVILNEVTSKNKSYLKGFTEVAGSKAKVIVANPNGVYINGAGFINTSSATITTGKPISKNGKLSSYLVKKGEIELDGEGLNTTNLDKAELYAKVVKLNSKIYANDLDVITGENEITVNGEIKSLNNNIKDSEKFSIDASSLGGIYANKIKLVATKDGVGVNLPIEISSQDKFTLNSDGKIVLGKVISDKTIEIKSSNDVQSDTLYGKDGVNLSVKNTLTNKNLIASEKDIQIDSTKFKNEGLVSSGVKNDLKESSTNANIKINTKSLDNTNTIISKNKLDIKSENILNDKNSILSAQKINLESKKIINNANTLIQAQKDINIDSKQINVSSSKIISQEGNIDVKSDMFLAKKSILSSQNLDLEVKDIINLDNSKVLGTNLDIKAKDFSNKNGYLGIQNKINIKSNNIDNHQGTILSNGTLSINNKNDFYNLNGVIQSKKNLILNIYDFIGDYSKIQASKIDIIANNIEAKNSNILAIDDNLSIKSTNGINLENANQLISLKNLNLMSNNVNLNNAKVSSQNGNIDIKSTSLYAQNSSLSSENINLDVINRINLSGARISTNNFGLKTKEFNNEKGYLLINQNGNIQSTIINNKKGTIKTGGSLNLNSSGILNSEEGILQANDTLSLNASDIKITQAKLQGSNVDISANNLEGKKANILALKNNLNIYVKDKVDLNQSEQLASQKDININSKNIYVNDTNIMSQEGDVSINGDILNTKNTTLNSLKLKLNIKDKVDLSKAKIVTNEVDIKTKELNTTSLYLGAQKDINIESENINNKEGTIISKNSLNISTTKILNNVKGVMQASKNLILDVFDLNTQDGIIQGGDIDIKANSLYTNKSNILASKDNLNIKVNGSFNNTNDSYIKASKDLNIDTSSFYGSNSKLVGDNIKIKSSEVLNSGDTIFANNNINIDTRNYSASNSTIQANKDIKVDSSSIMLNNSKVQSSDNGNINFLTSETSVNNGLISANNVTIGQDKYTKAYKTTFNNSTLDANSDLNILTNVFNSDNTKFLAQGQQNIRMDSIQDDKGYTSFKNNVFSSLNDIELRVNEDVTFDNTNNFSGVNGVSLSAKSLTNNAQVSSNSDIHIKADDYIINNALLSAKNIVYLEAGDYITNNDSNKNQFGIKGAYTKLKAKTINNYGLISSLYETDLEAKTINNYAGIASLNKEGKSTFMKISADDLNNYNTIIADGNIDLDIKNGLRNETNNSVVALGGQKAAIYSTNNIKMHSSKNSDKKIGSIVNISSLIQTKYGNIDIITNSLYNRRSQEFDSLYKKFTKEEKYGRISEILDKSRFEYLDSNRIDDFYNIYYPEYNLKIYLHKVADSEGISVKIKGLEPKNNLNSQYSSIFSGSKLNINANELINEISEIASVNDMSFSNSSMSFKNKDINFNSYLDFVNETGQIESHGYHEFYNLETGELLFKANVSHPFYSYVKEGDKIPSTVISGGKIYGNIDKLQNGIEEHKNPAYSIFNQTLDTSINETNIANKENHAFINNNQVNKNIQSKQINNNNSQVISKMGLISANNTIKNPNALSDKNTNYYLSNLSNNNNYNEKISLPKNKFTLFTSYGNENKLDSLVSFNKLYSNSNTNNEFASKYYLNKLGYKNDLKRLGDSFYEKQLVRDSIISQTGQGFLNPNYKSEDEQYEELLSNAVKIKEQWNLNLGEKPSLEQLVSLDKNIIWYEQKIVNGNSVLVPVIYLAKNQKKISGASIISNGDMNLKVNGKAFNSGNILSNSKLYLKADEMKNSGLIEGIGNTRVVSKKDFVNENGGKVKGANLRVISTDGSVINKTYVKQIHKGDEKHNTTYTQVGKKSGFESTSGDLIVQAKNDIKNIGGELISSKHMILDAKTGSVDFKTIELKDEFNSDRGSNFYKSKDINYLKSSAKAGGKIIMKAGDEINLESAKLKANDLISLKAKNDINLTTVNNVEYKDVQTHSKKSFGRSKTKRDMTYKESVEANDLDGKDIVLSSGKNINMEATHLKAKDNILLDASNDVNILAKEYKEGELHYSKKSGFGGLSKSVSLESSDVLKLKSSKLETTAKNIAIKSGNNIKIIASEIDSASNLQLDAVDKVLVSSKEELLKNKKLSKKTRFNLTGLLNLTGIDAGAIYTQEVHNKDSYDKSSKSSSLKAKNNIIIKSGETTIKGSDLEAGNLIGIKADTGKINIISANDSKDTSSLDKKVEVKLSSALDIAKSATEQPFKLGETKVKLELAKAQYDSKAKVSKTNGVVKSTLKGKNIVLDALEDINVQGSDLLTQGGDIIAKSEIGNVNILNDVETNDTKIKEKHAKATVNLTVQNEYVEIANSVKAVQESAKQLKQTKKDYVSYKKEVKKLKYKLTQLKKAYKNKEVGIDRSDIEDLVDIIDNLKSQEKYYLASITAGTADLASKTTAIATQAATAANSSGTYGFSVGLGLDVQGNKSNTKTNSQKVISSNLKANNILIQAKNGDTNIIGSNLKSKDNLLIDTTNLNVQAAQEINNSDYSDKSINGSVNFTMYGGGGGTASLGYGKTNINSSEYKNVNSNLKGNKVIIKASNNANFKGATVRGEENLVLDVKNDLNIESLRDEYSSNQKGFNVNAGVGFGNTVNSVNGGFNVKNGNTLNKQTNLTSLTGNKVQVKVGGNTNLKGSLLASGNFDENNTFIDNKNLEFETNSLTFENLSNTSFSTNKELGANVNVNLGQTQKDTEKKTDTKISKVGYNSTNSLNISKSKTLATLGQGKIKISDKTKSDDLSLLNTDTKNINKELYSSNTKTKVDATLDTRLLTEDGRKGIKDDHNTATAITKSINQIASNNKVNITDFFSETKKNVDVYNGMKEVIANDKNLSKRLEDPNLSVKNKQAMLNTVAVSVMKKLGYKVNNVKLVDTNTTGVNNTQVKGHFSAKTNTSYVNDKNNKSTKELVSSLGHELTHDMDKQDNVYKSNDKDQNIYATNFGEDLADYTDKAMDIVSDSSMATTNNHNNSIVTTKPSVFNENSNILKANNNEFANIDKSGGDDLCVNSAECYGSKTQDLFKSSAYKPSGKLSNYNLIDIIDKNGNTVGHSLYNPKTKNNIILKPKELSSLEYLANSAPDKFKNIMASNEITSNYKHTSWNTVIGLHDEGKLGGALDSWEQYGESGDWVIDLLGGATGKFVKAPNINTSNALVKVGENLQNTQKFTKKQFPTVNTKTTKESIQKQLDKLPNNQGKNYTIRENSNDTFSVVRKEGNKNTQKALKHNETTPIKVSQDGYLSTPNAVKSNHGNTLNDTPSEMYILEDKNTKQIVKVGETIHGESRYGTGNQKRYTDSQLDDMGAEYKKQQTGTKSEMYDLQNLTLEEYKNKYGEYPKYNKNGR